ncbi:MAG: hypothetical protein JO044_06205 [Mycobacteriaceae bacterium]|nr:hypothetical protein [Mycobacteriaceae bacterium]
MPEYESGLEAVARSDRLLDALAAGARMSPADPVASMLAGWRDEVRRAPDTHVISLGEAAAALTEGKQARPRQRFGMTVVGGVAAALLCLGGFGAVIYGAGPGDALYGLRTVLFGAAPTTRGDQVALAAQTELSQVQQLVQQGQWQQAQDKLAAVSTTVQDVTDVQRKQDLINQWNDLSAKVVARDPGATLTPGAPPPILPGMTAPLLPGPSVVPGSSSTSSSSSSSSSTSSSSTSSSSSTTSGSETPTSTSGTTSSSTTTPTPSPAAAPPPSPSPSPAPSSESTTTSTAGNTPTTTAAPPPATTTTTVTSAPRTEETSTSAAAATSPSQQQAPAVVNQQQTTETAPSSTADGAHGGEHGSAPGPHEPTATTPERPG